MRPDHEAAHNEILARAAGLKPGDELNAWNYAAHVARLFPTDQQRTLRQLHQHAGYGNNEVKKEVFRKAAAIFTELTGTALDSPNSAKVNRLDIAYTAADPGVLPGFAMAAVA